MYRANTFNPKKFDYDTPKTVVVEYLKSVEEDLMKTYLKYSEKEDLTLEQIIEIEGIRGMYIFFTVSYLFLAPKPVEGVSLKPEFEKDQVTESEKLQIQNEKDVFEMKLNSDEQALVDKIISNFSENFPASERNVNFPFSDFSCFRTQIGSKGTKLKYQRERMDS